jgi:hypothetical protein
MWACRTHGRDEKSLQNFRKRLEFFEIKRNLLGEKSLLSVSSNQ